MDFGAKFELLRQIPYLRSLPPAELQAFVADCMGAVVRRVM